MGTSRRYKSRWPWRRRAPRLSSMRSTRPTPRSVIAGVLMCRSGATECTTAHGQTPQEWRNPSNHDQNHHHSQNRMHAHNLDSDKHYDPDGLHYTDHPHGALPNMSSTAHDSYKTGDIHTATMHAPAQHADPGTAKKLQGNVPVGAHDAMMHYHPQQGTFAPTPRCTSRKLPTPWQQWSQRVWSCKGCMEYAAGNTTVRSAHFTQ